MALDPGFGEFRLFIFAIVAAIVVFLVGLLAAQVIKEVGTPSSSTLSWSVVVALIVAALLDFGAAVRAGYSLAASCSAEYAGLLADRRHPRLHDQALDAGDCFSIAKRQRRGMVPRLCCIERLVGFSSRSPVPRDQAPCLRQSSEHAEDDCRKEGEGDDGGKHVEPHPQFHLGFLCRNEPALRCRLCGPNSMSLRRLRRGRQEKSTAAVH